MPLPERQPALAPTSIDVRMLGRALAFSAAVAGLVLAAVGGVAFGATDWLPGTSLPYFVTGYAAAVFAAMIGVWLHGRFLDGRRVAALGAAFASDPRLQASRLQSLLAAAFGGKLFVLIVGVFGLRQAGAKFADITTFAVTFAGASLLCQLATAGFLSRAVQLRGGRAQAPTDPLPGPNQVS